ncbi:hypothetical protein NRI_0776 [Neorickettsia risticii str. Illinois]|uniref:Uncharacterized protein n=1 Tax=Neorickettsia risticii (strain Illinois) TaxID=434131 RepID=C6V5T0_NEORI|nr:hypothetical protein NRI_0776 [Neorickettsia risticii str. Illinois]
MNQFFLGIPDFMVFVLSHSRFLGGAVRMRTRSQWLRHVLICLG